MKPVFHKWTGWIPLLALLCATPAFAQGSGGTTSLSGVVVDADGGVIPGATIEIKNNATAVVETVVSNASGAFAIPALTPGTYTVTVSLSGFKTYVMNDVRLVAATPADDQGDAAARRAHRDRRGQGRHGPRPDAATTVQSTMLAEQITKLPLVSRNALSSTSCSCRASSRPGGYRAATINGLPQNTISITLDGIGIGNNLQSTDGFYTQVFPRLDAIEEVTVTGATPDAAGGAQGSVQVAFVTRSGSNTLRHAASITTTGRRRSTRTTTSTRSTACRRTTIIVHQFGGRVGGPISPEQGVLLLQLRAVPPAERGDAHAHDPPAAGAERRCSGTTSPARSAR